MSNTTGSGEKHQIDTSMMYAVHDAFRRDLDRLTALAVSGPTGGAAATDPAVRVSWKRFTTFLHIHHTAEDTHLWPVLRRKLTGHPVALAVLDQMDIEHAGLTALLDAVDASLTPSSEPGQWGPNVDRLAESLAAHCEHEEELALPLVTEWLSNEEWLEFGHEQRRRLGLSGAATFFPWLLDGANDEVQHTVLGYLPPPVRLLYRTVWRPRYLRSPRLQALVKA